MSASIAWTELIKDRKGVVTKDNQSCGNIIGENEENIVIEDGVIRQHFYRVPKLAVEGYNGAELTLNMQYNELETYEEKEEGKDKRKEGSITEALKNKVTEVKEKTADKATEVKEKTADKATEVKEKTADKATEVKEKTADKATEVKEKTADKASDVGHADNVKYQAAGEVKGQDESKAMSSYVQTTSANTDTTHKLETEKELALPLKNKEENITSNLKEETKQFLEQQNQQVKNTTSTISETTNKNNDNINQFQETNRTILDKNISTTNRYQHETINTMQSILNNYVELQKNLLNSFQSVISRFLNDASKLYSNNFSSKQQYTDTYNKTNQTITDNTINYTQRVNDFALASIESFNKTIEIAQKYYNESIQNYFNFLKKIERSSSNQ